MEISYDYYRIFYYVGRYKSFSKAAEMLMSNQPNVTKIMNKLEKQLNCTLFVRSNKGVALTLEGQRLYERVQVAYQQIRQAELELQDNTGLEKGMIRIGTSETALHGLLLPVLQSFHKKYPGVRICLLGDNTPKTLETLKRGLVDFAVVTSPVELHKRYKVTDITSFTEILVDGNQRFQEDSFPISLRDTREYPLISLSNDSGSYTFYTEVYRKAGLPFEPDIQVTASDQLLPLIERGLGIGFVAEFMAERALQEKRVTQIPLKEKLPERKICLVEDTDKNLNIAAKTLRATIVSLIKDT